MTSRKTFCLCFCASVISNCFCLLNSGSSFPSVNFCCLSSACILRVPLPFVSKISKALFIFISLKAEVIRLKMYNLWVVDFELWLKMGIKKDVTSVKSLPAKDESCSFPCSSLLLTQRLRITLTLIHQINKWTSPCSSLYFECPSSLLVVVMLRQVTLGVIKPDVLSRANRHEAVSSILGQLGRQGFHVLQQRELTLSTQQAEAFYQDHRGKFFYPRLISSMTRYSGFSEIFILIYFHIAVN